jgi:hypothetical protein
MWKQDPQHHEDQNDHDRKCYETSKSGQVVTIFALKSSVGVEPAHRPVLNSTSMADVARREPPRFGIGSFLFIVVFAVILFLVAQSMVRHRFHVGGRINRNGTLRQ